MLDAIDTKLDGMEAADRGEARRVIVPSAWIGRIPTG
jgi:hypothetical protein